METIAAVSYARMAPNNSEELRNMKRIQRLAFVMALFLIGLFNARSAFTQKVPLPVSSTGTPGRESQGLETKRSSSPGRSSGEVDATFVKKAASGGIAEVKLGELAEENGSSSAVKEFGKRMEKDHSKAGDQLKQVASKNNIAVPKGMDKKDQATYDHLSKLSGAEFDQVYAQHMVTDHEQDIEDFKNEASTGENPDVKRFASSTLPILQDHLRQAREMEKSVSAREGSKNSE
jgi:putative membrane protein